jgi:hypothetical protein
MFDAKLSHRPTRRHTHTHNQPSISTASIPESSTFSKHVLDVVTHPPCPPVAPLSARTTAKARGLRVLISLQGNPRQPLGVMSASPRKQTVWPSSTLGSATNACHRTTSLGRCDRRDDACDKSTVLQKCRGAGGAIVELAVLR